MIDGKKVGVGIVTYNRQHGLLKLYQSLPRELIDALIVVNDGQRYPQLDELDCEVHHNENNEGVGRSKNTALRYLQAREVDHFFLIEDDIFVKDPTVFARYIALSAKTGIQHFNFSQHGPKNVREDGTQRIMMQVKYDEQTLVLYPACVGAFCYYSRLCLEKVGLMDEIYYNAVEHLEHTYRVGLAGMHPSYHYFADLENSAAYLGDESWSPQQSNISGKLSSRAISMVAVSHFGEKYGCLPPELPVKTGAEINRELKEIRKRYAIT
ncbi:hypothetical protein N5923_17015 [Erwiniaceae bacterium BAC15a-03b]|uniref:Glycosyltransferase 2-like domain-containing protein n=1 Tax=Winslowiella arboricola TaxID=2978220 RepID=A0A9J6PP44_9GAMM|nr:glycosyltransferase [Winslowiella arboricola]MCU5773300.1 hypothetical protein [Winslowiella arboricola]MCU5779186.1 hypothetical protein [Winslowiella arboricola]